MADKDAENAAMQLKDSGSNSKWVTLYEGFNAKPVLGTGACHAAMYYVNSKSRKRIWNGLNDYRCINSSYSLVAKVCGVDKSNVKAVIEEYADWVLNRSIYSEAYLTKDFEINGCLEVNTKIDRYVSHQALIAIRCCWENQNIPFYWWKFKSLGFSESLALCMAHLMDVKVYWSEKRRHLPSGFKATSRGHTPLEGSMKLSVNTPYNMEHGIYDKSGETLEDAESYSGHCAMCYGKSSSQDLLTYLLDIIPNQTTTIEEDDGWGRMVKRERSIPLTEDWFQELEKKVDVIEEGLNL